MTEATKDANADAGAGGPIPAFVGWICAALSIAYTFYIHQGLAIPPGGMATEWYHANNSLTNIGIVGGWIDTPALGTFFLTLPTMILTILCAFATRSAIARTLCICTIVLAALIAVHGLAFTQIWDFFHWRWSMVLFWSGLFVGIALSAPLLAASWLRLPGWAKALTYVPPAFVVLMIIIHTTGTDPELFFNLSPWPVITGFALRIAVYSTLGIYLGIAVGVGVEALGKASLPWTIVGAALAIGVPVLWFVARFGTKGDGPVGVGIAGVVGFVLAQATFGGNRVERLGARAIHIAVAVVLVAVPLFSGRAIAVGNHSYTRDVAAAQLIQALRTYYQKNEEYPAELSELVDAGILDEIPEPRIGYGFIHALGLTLPQKWKYQMLGSSYLLEFSSTEWVMCTYSSPWEPLPGEEEEDWGDDEEMADDDGDPWSCPQRPPDLWGGPEQGAAADDADADEEEEGDDY